MAKLKRKSGKGKSSATAKKPTRKRAKEKQTAKASKAKAKTTRKKTAEKTAAAPAKRKPGWSRTPDGAYLNDIEIAENVIAFCVVEKSEEHKSWILSVTVLSDPVLDDEGEPQEAGLVNAAVDAKAGTATKAKADAEALAKQLGKIVTSRL